MNDIRTRCGVAAALVALLAGSPQAGAQAPATNKGLLHLRAGTVVSQTGDFTNAVTGTLEQEGTIELKGSWTNDGAYSSGAGRLKLTGSGAQDISGTAPVTFRQLEIDKPAQGVTLGRDIVIAGQLILTGGRLDLNGRSLTLSAGGTDAIVSSGGYLLAERTDHSSRVRWQIGTVPGSHIIPFGTAGGDLLPLSLHLTSGDAGMVTASTYPTGSDNTPLPADPVAVGHLHNMNGQDNSAGVADRFWHLDQTGADGTFSLTFRYADNEAPAGGETGLAAQHYEPAGNAWAAALPGQTADTVMNAVHVSGTGLKGAYALAQGLSPLGGALPAAYARLSGSGSRYGMTAYHNAGCACFCVRLAAVPQHGAELKAVLYDASGRVVAVRTPDPQSQDGQTFHFAAGTCTPGVYLVRLFDGGVPVQTVKVVY
jgi:hypothetical protein